MKSFFCKTYVRKNHKNDVTKVQVMSSALSMFLNPQKLFDKKIALAPGSATSFSMDLRQKCEGGDCWYRCPGEQMHHLKRSVLPDERKYFIFREKILVLSYVFRFSALIIWHFQIIKINIYYLNVLQLSTVICFIQKSPKC